MNLEPYEQEILKDFEEGKYEIIPHSEKERQRLKEIAARTLRMKGRRANVRLSELDYQAIQKKAMQEGIPYQTLIASLIHKYTTGLLIDRSSETPVLEGDLDPYEQDILNEVEAGNFVSDNLSDAERDRLKEIAARTLRMKGRRVNIRLTEFEYQAIQKKAMQEGLPYQTLIASLIHKYTTGLLIDRSSETPAL